MENHILWTETAATKTSAEAVTLPNGTKASSPDHTVARGSMDGTYASCCFGFVTDHLFLGDRHHAKIIYELIESGKHDFESLMNAEQKWGWIQKWGQVKSYVNRHGHGEETDDWGDNDLVVRFTTDEAKQSDDLEFTNKVVESISQYFNNQPAHISPDVGAVGTTTQDDYGGRTREQYMDGGSNEAYCEDCDEYYDPEYEDHDHERYCQDCGDYYNSTDSYDRNYHNQPYCENCNSHYDEEDELEHDHDFVPEPWMPAVGTLLWYKERYWKIRNRGSTGVIADQLNDPAEGPKVTPYEPETRIIPWSMFKSQEVQKVDPNQLQLEVQPQKPSWLPPGLHLIPTKEPQSDTDYWNEISQPNPPQQPLASVVDLHDDRVFAILVQDYIAKYGAPMNQDEWSEGMDRIHQMGQDILNVPQQYDEFGSAVDKANQSVKGLIDKYVTPKQQEGVIPQTQTQESTQSSQWSDNPALLAIERNKDSTEWRWSYDGTQLHIWRVLNRWQYGPSHYDMFGSTGYSDHSQGRVYVSPDGQVGVLYWQISHPETEDVLDQWVEKTYGKMPDMIYRAYGPYKGYKTPRYDFPIVEVSGLPLHQHEKWWEQPGRKSPSWYQDQNIDNPYDTWKRKTVRIPAKDYPAPKQKTHIPGPVDDSGNPVNPEKRNRRRKRRQQKQQQYRNRGRR